MRKYNINEQAQTESADYIFLFYLQFLAVIQNENLLNLEGCFSACSGDVLILIIIFFFYSVENPASADYMWPW